MGALAEKLFEARLITKKDLKRQRRVERLNRRFAQLGFTILPGPCDVLDQTVSMDEFKRLALELVQSDPELIETIAKKAYRFKGAFRENQRFLWLFFHLRSIARKLPKSERGSFLVGALGPDGLSVLLHHLGISSLEVPPEDDHQPA